MKIRILILSIIGLIIFNSCSSDSNSNNQDTNTDPSSVLPKKIIITNNQGSIFEFNFFYNGNKIDHINRKVGTENWILNYTYNGDFITQIDNIGPTPNTSSVLNFTYQNGKIVSFTVTGFYGFGSVDFQYGANGLITRTYTRNGSLNSYGLTMTDLSNGLPTTISPVGNNPTNSYSTISYTTTNSVYKNIVGYNGVLSNLYFTDLSVNSFEYTSNPTSPYTTDEWESKLSSINNYSSIVYPLISNYGGRNRYDYSYVYNQDNYPTSYQVFNSFGQPVEYGTIIYY